MRSIKEKIKTCVNDQIGQVVLKLGVVLGAMIVVTDANAADLLAGTTGDVIDTMKGAGKHWAIIVDGAISLGAFSMTKKPTVFFSVLAISVAMTAMLKLVGG